MRIAILSDIHDNVWNLNKALSSPKLQSCSEMIFCGDLCAPFVVKLLGQGFTNPIHIVLGNNDGDLASIIANATQFEHITIHGEYLTADIGGIAVAANHYPDNAREIASGGSFQLVCYGHNHTLHQERIGETLLVNPGAIMGYHGGKLEDIPPTYIIIDPDSMTVETQYV